MNKFLLAVFAAVAALAVGPAAAADMTAKPAYKAPPPPAPAPSWTGFYVGAGLGYGMWNADTGLTFGGVPQTATVTNGGRGWLGKVTAGYDYQFTSNIVAGVFGDYDFANIKGWLQTTTGICPFCNVGGNENENSSWAVGGRIGWLITPDIFSYWNGGYTAAHFDTINLVDQNGFTFQGTIPSNTYHGWFTGGGVETRVTFLPITGLFFNTEYRYASYNMASFPSFTIPGDNVTIRPYVQTITSGLVYKFNWTP